MIPGDLLSTFPHRQFHTLPGLLDSWAALPNSNPNACMPMQGGSLYHFYDGLWYDPAERRTHDLPCERRTRYRLSQPDTVHVIYISSILCKVYSYQPLLWVFGYNVGNNQETPRFYFTTLLLRSSVRLCICVSRVPQRCDFIYHGNNLLSHTREVYMIYGVCVIFMWCVYI